MQQSASKLDKHLTQPERGDMYRHYGWQGILVLPEDLIAFAWSAPMRDLARKIGISDVGLRKLLVGHGVVLPPQGHWNRVHAGRSVPAPPRAPPRGPGGSSRLWIDQRFAPFVPKVKPLPSAGPFATPSVPEDLEELRERELKAIGRVTVPKSLEDAHRGLKVVLAKEAKRRQKGIDDRWNWDHPKFDKPLEQRRLRLFNGIFLALARRGHDGEVCEGEEQLTARVRIGDTWLGLELTVAGKHRTVTRGGYRNPESDQPASTPLVLTVRPGFDREVGEIWQDDDDGRLETKLAPIAAGLITAGEAKFREELRLGEERAERERIEAEAKAERERIAREERRLERLRKLNEQRVADLQRSGELLRLSQDIRVLVGQVRAAVAGREDIASATLAEWERWALVEADKLDPVLSGQFLTHLRPPAEGDGRE